MTSAPGQPAARAAGAAITSDAKSVAANAAGDDRLRRKPMTPGEAWTRPGGMRGPFTSPGSSTPCCARATPGRQAGRLFDAGDAPDPVRRPALVRGGGRRGARRRADGARRRAEGARRTLDIRTLVARRSTAHYALMEEHIPAIAAVAAPFGRDVAAGLALIERAVVAAHAQGAELVVLSRVRPGRLRPRAAARRERAAAAGCGATRPSRRRQRCGGRADNRDRGRRRRRRLRTRARAGAPRLRTREELAYYRIFREHLGGVPPGRRSAAS